MKKASMEKIQTIADYAKGMKTKYLQGENGATGNPIPIIQTIEALRSLTTTEVRDNRALLRKIRDECLHEGIRLTAAERLAFPE